MDQPTVAPYRRPFCPADQLCKIDAVNRNTLLGWINRYDHHLRKIGIEPVARGGSRFFTMEQIGLFAALRSALGIKQADGVLDALPAIADHAATLYATLTSGLRWEEWGSTGERRPYLPAPDQPSQLEGRQGFGLAFSFRVTDRPYFDGGESLRDLAGFPLPVLLLPLDATLRHAWTRATWVFNEIALPQD